MTDPHGNRGTSGWSAVQTLIERWADLPPTSWRMLVSAERVTTSLSRLRAPSTPPNTFEQWLVRDLVETAWTMANTTHPAASAGWADDARSALERLAWRMLEPRSARPSDVSNDEVPPRLRREG